MQATPATWTMLFRSGWRNEEGVRILCGGEALAETLRRASSPPAAKPGTCIGPTETTIWSTVAGQRHGPITSAGRSPTRRSTCSTGLEPCRSGVPGELWIAGDGVAAATLNRPELTQERSCR